MSRTGVMINRIPHTMNITSNTISKTIDSVSGSEVEIISLVFVIIVEFVVCIRSFTQISE
jgi:hypothetical protein